MNKKNSAKINRRLRVLFLDQTIERLHRNHQDLSNEIRKQGNSNEHLIHYDSKDENNNNVLRKKHSGGSIS